MVKVKYNEIDSQDGYSYRTFDNYEDFEYWFCKSEIKIIILDIKRRGLILPSFFYLLSNLYSQNQLPNESFTFLAVIGSSNSVTA